ncbi:MAG: hypothetical protein LBR21_02055 [Propionibacteriaceae bacterium]|jgi:hypothetical protein|nr:hypothetical protein [Propionibacteriaceae bacterium]
MKLLGSAFATLVAIMIPVALFTLIGMMGVVLVLLLVAAVAIGVAIGQGSAEGRKARAEAEVLKQERMECKRAWAIEQKRDRAAGIPAYYSDQGVLLRRRVGMDLRMSSRLENAGMGQRAIMVFCKELDTKGLTVKKFLRGRDVDEPSVLAALKVPQAVRK